MKEGEMNYEYEMKRDRLEAKHEKNLEKLWIKFAKAFEKEWDRVGDNARAFEKKWDGGRLLVALMLALTHKQYIALIPPLTIVDGDTIESLFARELIAWDGYESVEFGKTFCPTSLGKLAARVYEQYQTVSV